MTPTVLIVGAGGQLGEAMTATLRRDRPVVAVTRSELDVTHAESVRALVARIAPQVIINCSAYTNVDRSEQEPLQALQVNAMAVRALARAADDLGATLVHYSTDFVFDGKTDRPYTESDPVNPRGTYASSKLLGEWLAMETPRHYVLRVESLFGGAKAHSSVDKILANLQAGAPVRAFVDRTVSPSFVDDVITATTTMLGQGAPFGLYHCVNSGWTNWVELSRELARLIGKPDAAIEDIRMADAGLLANRPLFAALSNAKLLAAGVPMPTWQDALARYARKVRS